MTRAGVLGAECQRPGTYAGSSRAEPARSLTSRSVLAFLLPILVATLLLSCGGQPPPSEQTKPPSAVTKQVPLPADFVVIVDNSRSITPPEQVLVRETTMLLADLADQRDRVSVITFGQNARVAVSVDIQSDADRTSFKRQVRAKVDFAENYSDIRRGIRILAQNQEVLFRGKGQSARAVILLSDGKLEPADRKTKEAFQEIQADLREALPDTSIYAVVLGDTYSRDTILQVDGRDINGQILMREYIARSPDWFFHARKLDQVLDVAVVILNKSKGISSLGKEGEAEFRIDDTVESMTFIVRKRSTDGKTLAQSSDIELRWPGGQPVTAENRGALPGDTLYWSSDYEYFDLLVVRKPAKGLWSIGLRSGGAPRVLSKINTPIELRFNARDHYYLNEAATLTAWLFNKPDGEISKAPYEIQAHVTADGALADSKVFLPLQAAGDSGQYSLTVPSAFTEALKQEGKPGTIALELIAQRRETPGGTTLDPWFIRRSAPIRIELIEPFIQWRRQEPQLTRIPLRTLLLTFGGEERVPKVDAAAFAQKYHPVFDIPPRLTVSVERLDEKAQAYKPYAQKTLEGVPEATIRAYRFESPVQATGTYRYAYRLEGTTKQGRFLITSPSYGFTVRYCWECVGAALVVLLVVAEGFSRWTARLRGQLTARVPGGSVVTHSVHPALVFNSAAVASLKQAGVPPFTLVAKRILFVFRRRIRLTVTGGKAAFDKHPLSQGEPRSFPVQGKHTLRLTQADGTVTEIEMTLRV